MQAAVDIASEKQNRSGVRREVMVILLQTLDFATRPGACESTIVCAVDDVPADHLCEDECQIHKDMKRILYELEEESSSSSRGFCHCSANGGISCYCSYSE